MFRHETKDRIDALAGLEVLRHCDRHELKQLAEHVTERSFRSGEVLCRRGQPAEEVYFLATGNLAVVADGQLVATLAPGAIAGELGPLGPAVRCADLVALSDGELLVISATALRRMLAESPGLRRGVTPVLADRAEENDQRTRS